MGYTKDEILKEAQKALQNVSAFYKYQRTLTSKVLVNYRGKATDSKEYYTEIISKFVLDHIEEFKAIPMITREKSYYVDSHDKPTDNDTNREEEILAKELYRLAQEGLAFDKLGKIIDYQVPLKNVESDEAGKIDLLAYNEKDNSLRILELKRQGSDETMLRCALEGYTYLRTVNQKKLLNDLKEFGCDENTKIYACPFVFRNGSQHKEMLEGRENLLRLMKELDIYPYYIDYENGKYSVYEDEIWKLK